MMKEVRNIEAQVHPVVLELYQRFLGDRSDEELWAFGAPCDEVTANLVYANYMSAADISFCQAFDIELLSTEAGFEAKQVLHQALGVLYPADEFEAPV